MRLRAVILAIVVTTAMTGSLAACGGGDGADKKKPSAASTRLGTPSESVTETVLDCDKYSDTAAKIAAAQSELYTSGGADALAALKTELDALKDGAPSDVKAAVDELETGFEKVQEIIRNPTSEGQSELAEMAPKLSADGQKVSAYIVSQCK